MAKKKNTYETPNPKRAYRRRHGRNLVDFRRGFVNQGPSIPLRGDFQRVPIFMDLFKIKSCKIHSALKSTFMDDETIEPDHPDALWLLAGGMHSR